MIYSGIAEYGVILAAKAGNILTSMGPAAHIIVITLGFVFFFWAIVIKL